MRYLVSCIHVISGCDHEGASATHIIMLCRSVLLPLRSIVAKWVKISATNKVTRFAELGPVRTSCGQRNRLGRAYQNDQIQ